MKEEQTESLLREVSKIASELKRLDDMEAGARSAIVSATDEDVTTPAAQQKIADARLTLEVVSARRSKLKPPFSVAHQKLQERFRAEGNAWNDVVAAARREKERELVAAMLPYWNSEAAMRRVLGANLQAASVFRKYHEAVWHRPFYPHPEEQDLVRDVRLLLSHIERSKKALGIG